MANAVLRMHTCAGSSESLSHVLLTYQNIMTLCPSTEPVHTHCMHACADPEYFVRGGSESEPKCH